MEDGRQPASTDGSALTAGWDEPGGIRLGPTAGSSQGRASELALRTEGLSKRYGSVAALSDLDLEIGRGRIVGYLGPNGAGKTTTLRLITGLARPSAGRATIFGIDCHRQPVLAHRHMASVPSDAALWPQLTGGETLDLLGQVHGTVDAAYRAELVDRFGLDPTKKVRAYSSGNRQKVLLIGALMTRADLLVLDEPTTGLDPLMEQAFRECMVEARNRGQSVLLSSHVLSEVEAVCDEVALLRDGCLIDRGALSDLRHLSVLSVEARLEGDVPSLEGVEGVRGVTVDDHRLRCQVEGSVEPLLRVLAAAGTTHLVSRPPSLEELFLAHYGPSATDQTPVATG
ncbi:MAG: ABC transporter ATP-binding protein [Acidimicrobiales bacterium]|nr:ABC transporter ATP-binding protein [Acidimicrobiales bacterium]